VPIDYRARSAEATVAEHIGAEHIIAEHIGAEHTGGRGFDIVFDTVGGATLDASFHAVRRFGHVVSALGWGTHALAPLSFRAASYSGIFTLLPLLTGEGKPHHGEILRQATRLAEAGKIMPRVDPRRFTLQTVGDAYLAMKAGQAAGKLVVDIAA
jgi:NADPH:quinone reductase